MAHWAHRPDSLSSPPFDVPSESPSCGRKKTSWWKVSNSGTCSGMAAIPICWRKIDLIWVLVIGTPNLFSYPVYSPTMDARDCSPAAHLCMYELEQ
jgi:hypothetical protein